ncbi:Uncharacterized protein HZ326_18996 [Fusarium oxysporum f. sp. albedinis]|nr:Uncharacterized protein HZ326_18996 [Fusarium oxysporum f. sp. albedinis]
MPVISYRMLPREASQYSPPRSGTELVCAEGPTVRHQEGIETSVIYSCSPPPNEQNGCRPAHLPERFHSDILVSSWPSCAAYVLSTLSWPSLLYPVDRRSIPDFIRLSCLSQEDNSVLHTMATSGVSGSRNLFVYGDTREKRKGGNKTEQEYWSYHGVIGVTAL